MLRVGDSAYRFSPVRRWARAHHVRRVLPTRADQRRANARRRAPFDKNKRAVGTRYDKLASNYLAMVQVALIYSYLRHLYPSDRV